MHALSAERLPFESDSFDTVVSTFTLCSITDVASALQEVCRVLVPGGALLFLEHGLAPDESVARWQRHLTPVQKCIGGSCHLDRPINSLIEQAGLQITGKDIAAEFAPLLFHRVDFRLQCLRKTIWIERIVGGQTAAEHERFENAVPTVCPNERVRTKLFRLGTKSRGF